MTSPTEASTIEIVDRYLKREASAERLWDAARDAIEYYGDRPADPRDRVAYFWESVWIDAFEVARHGHQDHDLRTYLQRWLIALRMPAADWQELVRRKHRPLEENEPGWDT